MAACSHCGQELPRLFRELLVKANGDIYWRGIKQPRVAPQWSKLLFVLARRGECDTGTLLMVGGETFDARALQVQLSRIRRWLEANAIPLRIVSMHGYGYRLEQ